MELIVYLVREVFQIIPAHRILSFFYSYLVEGLWERAVVLKLEQASESWWGGLVKMQIPGSYSQIFWFCRFGGTQEFVFLTNSQVTLMAVVLGPHFENHCSQTGEDRPWGQADLGLYLIFSTSKLSDTWTSYFTFLTLSFVTCKRKTIITTTSQILLLGFNKIKHINIILGWPKSLFSFFP